DRDCQHHPLGDSQHRPDRGAVRHRARFGARRGTCRGRLAQPGIRRSLRGQVRHSTAARLLRRPRGGPRGRCDLRRDSAPGAQGGRADLHCGGQERALREAVRAQRGRGDRDGRGRPGKGRVPDGSDVDAVPAGHGQGPGGARVRRDRGHHPGHGEHRLAGRVRPCLPALRPGTGGRSATGWRGLSALVRLDGARRAERGDRGRRPWQNGRGRAGSDLAAASLQGGRLRRGHDPREPDQPGDDRRHAGPNPDRPRLSQADQLHRLCRWPGAGASRVPAGRRQRLPVRGDPRHGLPAAGADRESGHAARRIADDHEHDGLAARPMGRALSAGDRV
ncbi:MAG: hypothetical protein AVDCRST_MAG87-1490, partial [uncultured Thermomicrobiales bacterium]